MGKEQELRLDGFAEKLAAALSQRRVKLRDLEAEIGVSKSATSRAARGKSVSAENFVALWNWLRRSSSDEAEVEPIAWCYPEEFARIKAGKMATVFGTKADVPHPEIPLYASPSGVKAGVTEAQIEAATRAIVGCHNLDWDTMPARAREVWRGDARAALTAALGVRDEGMGEAQTGFEDGDQSGSHAGERHRDNRPTPPIQGDGK